MGLPFDDLIFAAQKNTKAPSGGTDFNAGGFSLPLEAAFANGMSSTHPRCGWVQYQELHGQPDSHEDREKAAVESPMSH